MTVSSRTVLGAGVAGAAGTGLALLLTMTAASAQVARTAGTSGPSAALVLRLPPGNAALDASPDPTGKLIYFTANGVGGPAVIRVPLAGGPVRPVLAGGPLRGPVGLAVSGDGLRVFVADPRAQRIFVVSATGGGVHALRGTAGSAPRGLEVERLGGRDYVVYTGRDPRTGRPAVLRIAARGAGRPTVVHEGEPLRRPDGVALSRSGAVFVTDQGAGGRALRIAGGRVTTVAGGVRLGRPGGIALTLDESRLLISSLNPATQTAQVLILDTRTGQTTTFDGVIGANRDPGGLHRARSATAMGWADVSRSGRVYRVEP
ncbi:MAG: hypothetical protein QOE44_668 [Solirubrobacteraceae bacterium]|nr:hypothetical protein [Solirubrobacteraceae bacterium]